MTAPVTQASATADEPVLLREDADGITTLILNRPRSYNALSESLIDALQAALDAIARDESVRVVILGAAGKDFCAGHDLKEMRASPDRDYYRALFAKCSRMMTAIVTLPQPVIARVQGIATAAGCQMVASCDLAVAADDARLATNGISNGLFCSTPAVALSRNVATKQAFEMLFTGEFVDAETARSMGLVNRIAPEADLEQAAQTLARSIAEKSPVTVRSGKAMFYKQLGLDLDDAYALAAETMACDMMSEDAGEGIDAFIQKRKPEWRDR